MGGLAILRIQWPVVNYRGNVMRYSKCCTVGIQTVKCGMRNPFKILSARVCLARLSVHYRQQHGQSGLPREGFGQQLAVMLFDEVLGGPQA